MAGITNSWIEQYTIQPTPCINPGSVVGGSSSTSSSWLVWFIIGFIAASVSFEKKGSHQ